MKFLFVHPLGFQHAIKLCSRSIDLFITAPVEHIKTAEAGNTFSILPRTEHVRHAIDRVALSEDFYVGVVNDLIAHGMLSFIVPSTRKRFVAGIRDAVRTLRKAVSVPRNDPTFSVARFDSALTAAHLIRLVHARYPGGASLLRYLDGMLLPSLFSGFGLKGLESYTHQLPTVDGYAERADEALEAADLLYPDKGFVPLLAEADADVVFCAGVAPETLAFSIGVAKKIREHNPRARVFLINDEWSLYGSLGHIKSDILHTPALFDHFDGAIVYADLQPLTLADLVLALSKGTPLDEIDNLARRVDGKVVFREPSATTRQRYFAGATLMELQRGVSPFQLDDRDDAPAWPVAARGAVVYPSQQACYWNRCAFCSINAQNALLRDPHIAERAKPAADFLQNARSHGYDIAFLGREAVDPEILAGIVEHLADQPDVVPWGMEARFGNYLSTDFVRRLRSANCVGGIFGLETATDQLNRSVSKYDTDMHFETTSRIIDDFGKNGMFVHVNTIIDMPGSTQRDFEVLTEFLKVKHRQSHLFHFNTNAYTFRHDTLIGRSPEKYGLRITAQPLDGVLGAMPTIERISGEPAPDEMSVWRDIYGGKTYRGLPLPALHVTYHESYLLSLADADQSADAFASAVSEYARLPSLEHLSIALSDDAIPFEVKLRDREYAGIFVTGDRMSIQYLRKDLWEMAKTLVHSGVELGQVFRMIPNAADLEDFIRSSLVSRVLVARVTNDSSTAPQPATAVDRLRFD